MRYAGDHSRARRIWCVHVCIEAGVEGSQVGEVITMCLRMTCIQISQEADQVVWYSHLFQNFPQFIVIHTVKGFCIINKAEIDIFLEHSSFFDEPADVGNLISGSSAFSKTSLNIWKFIELLYILSLNLMIILCNTGFRVYLRL